MQTKSTKGKTWEQIYGKEYAEIKMQKLMEQIKTRKSNKGKKWEDIYSPEEVARRKEMMKNHNPSTKLTNEQKIKKNEKLKEISIRLAKTRPNPMLGKKHTEETKRKMSKVRNERFAERTKDRPKKVRLKKFYGMRKINRDVEFTCKNCNITKTVKETYLYPHHDEIRKFCSRTCQIEYARLHPHIPIKPNGWEKIIISLDIKEVKFVGDHSFWIPIKFKGKKSYFKNPDFKVGSFSKNRAIIEILGKRFHSDEENKELSNAYSEVNVKHLFLTNEDFKKKDKDFLRSKIEGWMKENGIE